MDRWNPGEISTTANFNEFSSFPVLVTIEVVRMKFGNEIGLIGPNSRLFNHGNVLSFQLEICVSLSKNVIKFIDILYMIYK